MSRGTSLRVVLDARPLSHGQPGGFRAYLRALMQGLLERDGDEELILYMDRLPTPEVEASLPSRAQVRVLAPDRMKTDLRLFAEQVRRDAPDLVYGTVNYVPRLPRGVPATVAIHDAIGVRPRPWERGRKVAPRARLMAAYWATMTRHSARHARRIVTITQGAARDISETLHVPLERITVVSNGVLLASCPGSLARDERTALVIASPEPRKNMDAIYAAFSGNLRARYGPDGPPRLRVVCTYDRAADETEAALKAHGITDYEVLRRLEDSALAEAYARATVFVWPSFYEGFGMPPLEAMQSGCPVVSSNAPVMPEVLGDAPLWAAPDRPEEFADQIARVLSDKALQKELATRGRERAATFTCRRMAEGTVAAWRLV